MAIASPSSIYQEEVLIAWTKVLDLLLASKSPVKGHAIKQLLAFTDYCLDNEIVLSLSRDTTFTWFQTSKMTVGFLICNSVKES